MTADQQRAAGAVATRADAPSWDRPTDELPGVGQATARRLATAFGIRTVRDLLEHYPSQEPGKYRDLGEPQPVAQATVGEPLTVVGTIVGWQVIEPRGRGRRLVIAKATLHDDAGGVVSAPFFNQRWRTQAQPEGTRVAISGVLEEFRGDLQMGKAKLVPLDEVAATVAADDRIQATYPATEQLSSPAIRQVIRAALDELPAVSDFMPELLAARRGLLDLDTALRHIHRPTDLAQVLPARQRLVYDELLCLQLGLQQRRHLLESGEVGIAQPPVRDAYAGHLLRVLPFRPTGAQAAAFTELGTDLARAKPMHRLLQGDVGSGKTLVAAWTMLQALDNGRQAVLMAPTEVLAEQHQRTFCDLMAPLGVNLLDGPRVELVTAHTPRTRLRQILAGAAVGDVDILIGTHALLEDRVALHDLGVVVIDEQHRFGVEHRTRLRDKRPDGRTPDVLVMTATPIPRSLALTLYGDLDVTTLDELPPGRQQIVTQVIDTHSPRRAKLYAFIRERVAAGERAYVVCPLIASSDAEVMRGVAAAQDVHLQLSQEVFADLDVGLVHGQLPSAERDEVMAAFRAGTVQVLVATTVIEVGLDVPDATVMIVEDANRFGISQLHQLRGRVGRGSARSFCVLFDADAEAQDNPRLRALAATTDGFALAETDLSLRGEGSLFDTRQSGLADLKLTRLVRDRKLVAQTRQDAGDLLAIDPDLSAHPALADEVRRRYAAAQLDAMETG